MTLYIQKLDALSRYMGLWIDRYGRNEHMTFPKFCTKYYPQMVEGTPEYYRKLATNCFYCNKKLKAGEATIDHFIPRARGGGDNLKYNRYVICCKVCNGAKADKHPKYFQREIRKALTIGTRVGAIEHKRLQKVYDNLSQVINEIALRIPTPIYYRVCWTKRKPKLFFENQHT